MTSSWFARERRGEQSIAAAVLLALLFFLPCLPARGLLAPDEVRYADVALAMEESGEWLVPRLDGDWYFEKGPVFFWTIAALDELGVPLSIAPRLASLLALLGVIALMPRLARGFGLPAASAARGALVLVTLPLVVIYAQLGLTDLLFTWTITLAVVAKLERDRLPARRRAARVALALAEGVVLVLALLTKGPVALLFLAGLRGGAALARRDPDGRPAPGAPDRLDLLVLLAAAACAGAWLLATIDRAGGAYARALTLGQLERRVAGAERLHRVPPGFLIGVVLVGGLPWSLLAPWNALPAFLRRPAALRPGPSYAGLLGWGIAPLVLIALLPTQQPHYALPALPACALLAGEMVARPLPRAARLAAGMIGVVAGTGLLIAAATLRWFSGWLPFDPRVAGRLSGDLILVAGVAAAGAAMVGAVFWRRRGAERDVPARTVVGVAALACLLPIVCWRTDDLMRPRELLASPAIAHAKRIVAPYSMRSLVRVATRLPRIEGYQSRDLEELLRGDPELVALGWRDELEANREFSHLQVLAGGWLRGRELVAVRRREPQH